MKQKYSTQTTINLLLSGRHALYKRYAGKHVLVIKDKIVPFKSGKEVLTDMKKLEKKYGKAPTLIFVPRQDISYYSYTIPFVVEIAKLFQRTKGYPAYGIPAYGVVCDPLCGEDETNCCNFI